MGKNKEEFIKVQNLFKDELIKSKAWDILQKEVSNARSSLFQNEKSISIITLAMSYSLKEAEQEFE